MEIHGKGGSMAVSIILLRAVVEAVEAARVTREDFLARGGFDASRLEEIDGRLELSEYDALVEIALELTSDPALGLHMGSAATSSTYNLTAHLVAHSNTLREGLETLARYHRLLADRRAFVIEEGPRTVTLKYELGTGPIRCRRFRAEAGVTGFYRMVRYFDRQAHPVRVAFEHPAPPYREEYARTFDGIVEFEQSFTGLVIGREAMDATQLNRDDEFHATLRAQAAKRVARLESALTYAEKVRECVAKAPHRRDMSAVARALGMSSRSLRRRLTEEGAVYNDVVEQARASLATQLLIDERKTIQEVAQQLCYSDASAFSRAFKRWTGSTPKRFQLTRE
jgi:AraC-like DNA-binding protein